MTRIPTFFGPGDERPVTRRRSRRPGLRLVALGTLLAAWLAPARAPEPAHVEPPPSYATMADRLAELYPAARAHGALTVRVVHEEADRHRLDPCLVMAVIARESGFRPAARNRRDLGLMQVNVDWHPEVVSRAGGPAALFDPERNVRAGTEVLARYRRPGDGDETALRRYHGLGKRNDYVQRVQATARRLQAAGACLGEPPLLIAAR